MGLPTFLGREDACQNLLAVLEPHGTMSKERLEKCPVSVIVMSWHVSGVRHLCRQNEFGFWRNFTVGRRVLVGRVLARFWEAATTTQHCLLDLVSTSHLFLLSHEDIYAYAVQ